MAVPYNYGVPSVQPLPEPPNDYQHLDTPPGAFGAYQAAALKQGAANLNEVSNNLEQAVLIRQDFYNKTAGAEGYNQQQDAYTKVLHGDPNVPGDVGILGLKGRAAMDAWPDAEKKLDQIRQQIRGGLRNDAQRLQFDQDSRRLQMYTANAIGSHVDRETDQWGLDTARSKNANAARHAASFYNDDTAFNQSVEQARDSAVSEIHIKGAQNDPEIVKNIYNEHLQQIIVSRAEAMAASGDNAGALNFLQSGRLPPIRMEDGTTQQGSPFSEIVAPNIMSSLLTRYRDKGDDGLADAWVNQQMGGAVHAAGGLYDAIHGQEGSGATQTSPKGAKGEFQVTRGFFQDHANPGESFDNENDRVTVAKRGIDALNAQYNGDAARVAVAYFSGTTNVAPPGSPHPWIKDKSDGDENHPGTLTSQYVNGVLSRLGSAPQDQSAPSIGQMPDRSAIVQKAIQTFGDNSKTLDKVLSRLSRQFSIVDAATASERRALTESLPDMKEAALHGMDVTIPEDRIRAVFQPDEADKQITELTVAKNAGQIMSGIQYGSPAEVNNALSDLTSGMGTLSALIRARTSRPGEAATIAVPGSEESGQPVLETPQQYRMRTMIAKAARQAITQRAAALAGPDADPVAYVSQEPTVVAARNLMQTAPDDQKASATEAYLTTVLGVQDHLGVPQPMQHVLTRGQAEGITSGIASADPTQVDVGAQLSKMSQQYGKSWPKVFGDLVTLGRLPSQYQTLMAMPTGPARADFQRMLSVVAEKGDTEALKKSAGDEAAKDIERGIDAEMVDFKRTAAIPGLNINADLIAGVRTSIRNLALYYATQGQNSTRALDNAASAVFGRYDFNGTERVPKGTLGAVHDEEQRILDGLKPDDLMKAAPVGQQEADNQRQQDMLRMARRGFWAPNESDTGLLLVGQDVDGRPVIMRRKDGSRVELTFGQTSMAPDAVVPMPAVTGAAAVP